MNPSPAPLLCLWTRSVEAPASSTLTTLAETWPVPGPRLVCGSRTALPGWEAAPGDGTPLGALREARARWPGRDVVLVQAEARLPHAAFERLLAAGAGAPGIDVIATAGSALDALNPWTGPAPALAEADARCWLLAEHRVHPGRHWSPALSLWRADALARLERIADERLPPSLRGGLLACLYVEAPRQPASDPTPALPIAALRERLQAAPHRPDGLPGLDGRPVVLHILHGWGGGAWRFVQDLQAGDDQRHHLVLIAHGDWQRQRHGERLALHARLDAEPLHEWPLSAPIASTDLESAEYRAILAGILADWNVGAVLVSSLIGHSLDALRTGLPTAVCTHDYYPLWPRLHARFGEPDARFDDDALVAALTEPADSPFAERDPDDWRTLRTAYLDALARADAQLVAPTAGVRDNQCRMAPALAERRWTVIPHGASALAEVGAPHDDGGRLRVLVPGRIHGGKGEELLAELIERLPDDVELLLLGAGQAGKRFLGARNVHVLLDYRREELPALVARARPHLALLPSTVAETWSYTLSEMWQLGLPVLATALGSYRERIRDGENGLLVAPEPDSLCARLATLAHDPDARRALARLSAPPLPGLGAMASAWRQALPAEPPRSPQLPLADPAVTRTVALATALSAASGRIASLQTRLAEQQAELDRRADWAQDLQRQIAANERAFAQQLDERERGFERETAELRQQVEHLRDSLRAVETQQHELAERLQSAYALYDSDTDDLIRQRDVALTQRDEAEAERRRLLESRSWRLTAPLRAINRWLSDARVELTFRLRRTRNLLQRGLTSLRVRGLRHTLRRTLQELRAGTAPTPTLPPPGEQPAAATLPQLPECNAPQASIVIPVYNQLGHTLDCLRSLATGGDRTPFEVIVVDDGSSDDTATTLPQIPGLRFHRNPRNLGFIGACNAGAALARGEYLVFLNNDTQVRPGWLDALLDTFAQHERVGLVGSKLVYPDGRLQEAGGIVFADGSGWNYGRFDDPDDPRYSFVREADYCSGAAIAIPRALFDELGGFDGHYAPAYYEDTDLAMQVRARGLRVLYQPKSVVAHCEGVTAGTDTRQGVKAYQVANQRKFLARWQASLSAGHAAPGTPPELAARHRARRHILIVDACTPTPDRDSGSLRMLNLMRLLLDEGCAVTFFADNRAHDGAYTEALQQLGVEVWYRPFLGNIARWFAERGSRFDMVIASRHYVARTYLPLVRQFAPQARFVFDTVDLHYLRERREAELVRSPVMARNAEATREKELRLIRESDLTLVVSPMEREILAREAPGARVDVLSNVHAIPGSRRPFAERRDLVFVGGYRHPPNVDAVRWFVKQVLPAVRTRLPDVRVHLIGADAPESVRILGDHPGVVFHGYVRDLDPYMDGCRIAIAPLRYGAGVKGKVNLSMAHGQPVVATSCAVEGMHLRPGEDVLVADSPEAFADAIVRLYGDPALWQRLSDNGIENVRRHFSFDAARDALRRIMDSLLSARDANPATDRARG